MNPLVVLTLGSVLAVAAFFIALAVFLSIIARELEEIGGPATRFVKPVNYLSRIRLGVRAIERQTDALGPYVTGLNHGLGAIRDALKTVDANLAGLITAVSAQERR